MKAFITVFYIRIIQAVISIYIIISILPDFVFDGYEIHGLVILLLEWKIRKEQIPKEELKINHIQFFFLIIFNFILSLGNNIIETNNWDLLDIFLAFFFSFISIALSMLLLVLIFNDIRLQIKTLEQ